MTEPTQVANRLEILEGIPYLSSVPKKTLRALAEQVMVRTYPAGKRIIRRGDVGLGLFGILSGEVEISVTGPDGRPVPVRRRGKGAFVGEMALLDQSPRSADVDAVTEVECLVLTKDIFDAFVRKHPEVAFNIIPSLTAKVRELTDRVVEYERRIQDLGGSTGREGGQDANGETRTVSRSPIAKEAERIKDEVKDRVLDVVGRSHSLRVFANTYAVVLGCPARIEVPEPAGPVWLDSVGEVKVGLLDARVGEIEVVGEGEGSFELTIFAPGSNRPRRITGRVRSGSRSRFRLDENGRACDEP